MVTAMAIDSVSDSTPIPAHLRRSHTPCLAVEKIPMVVRWWWNSKTLNWPPTRVPMELTKWRTWRRKQARRELLGPPRGFRWGIFVSAEATVPVILFGNFFQAKGIQFLSVNCSLPATREAFDQHIGGHRLALPLLSRLETRTYRLWSILRRRQLPLLDVFYQAPFTCPHCPQFFPQFPHLCGLVKTEKIPPENVSILFILRMKKMRLFREISKHGDLPGSDRKNVL